MDLRRDFFSDGKVGLSPRPPSCARRPDVQPLPSRPMTHPDSVSSATTADRAALADLLARCRRHEPAAQRALYDRFAGPMLALARQYAPTTPDAEDAVQDAFLKVFRHLPEQRVDGAFAGWVRQIVVRTALDAWQRGRTRRPAFELDVAHHLPAPDASAVDQLTLAEVRALIERLPDGCRLVLLLYTVEGYSHQEIAASLGIGASASSAQLARARQRLAALVAAASREKRPAPPGPATVRTATATATDRPAAFNPLTTLLFQ